MTIERERIHPRNDRPVRDGARYVLYWMQASQRAAYNPALEYAVAEANRLRLPVLVGFGLTARYPEANLRSYTFMAEGLLDTHAVLARRGIPFVLRHGEPDAVALDLVREAALVVMDRGYLRHQRAWRERVAAAAPCACVEVEGDAVVPVEAVSDHAEFAARTLRPKIHRLLESFLKPLPAPRPRVAWTGPLPASHALASVEDLLRGLPLDRTVAASPAQHGGPAEARRRLDRFLKTHLADYATLRSDPAVDRGSCLSAYLHFGQISPVEIALAVRAAPVSRAAADAFIEELVVRRELALNQCWFNPAYDRYEGLPAWARRTLEKHRQDARPYRYDAAALEAGDTHDAYWNAAQREMVRTGRMHGYMRMYWGKKLLEWSGSPEEAFAAALRLNNRHELDGRDPNGFVGVAWCFGLHDRPWTERPVFGQVRYMNEAGLRRKFDMEAYLERVNARP